MAIVLPTPTPPAPDTRTPQQKTLDMIEASIVDCANNLIGGYKRLRRLYGATADGKNPFGLTTKDIVTAIESSKPVGMGAADLQEMAIVIKTVLNRYVPGNIRDDVPEATITLPKE